MTAHISPGFQIVLESLLVNMEKLRKYGDKPFNIAVIHGGPGAPGEMAPVAKELSSVSGIMEPLQAARTCEGQVQELETVLEEHGDLPVTLIGHSWGAMLSFIFTARYPSFIKKLILVGSGVFEDKYAANIETTRWTRFSEREKVEAISLSETLKDPDIEDKNAAMARLGKLWARADSYQPLPLGSEILEFQYDINKSVWAGAKNLRSSGQLLDLGRKISCPVVAIHGDYDPHPIEGVKDPLSSILKNFRFIILEKCGHYPWMERSVRDRFYAILKNEI
ncbi:alpha/beta fold hydrolase [Chloroflexota bacterium]